MHKYAAFLRGISPTGRNMQNDKLRGVFERLGFGNVRSVISSGNILFEAEETATSQLESKIEQALKRDLGINSTSIIRSSEELQALAEADPFRGFSHQRQTYLTVTFLKHVPSGRKSLPQPSQATDVLGIDTKSGAVFAVTDTTSAKTPDFMTWLEHQFGKDITTRTWQTIERINKKLAG